MSTHIRLSELDKQRLERIQDRLRREGIDKLKGLREVCPKCGELMDGFRLETEYLRCPNCGHEEKSASFSGTGAFALGAIAGGVATAALLWYLKKKGVI